MPDPTPAPQMSAIADKSLEAKPVADEIKDSNTFRVWLDDETSLWYCRLGPAKGGITAQGLTANSAVIAALLQAHSGGWIFDPSWKPAA